MAIKFCKFILYTYSTSPRNQFRICSIRTLFLNQLSCNKEKITMEILPDLEKLLESGEVKHRKHPGIRKILPLHVPEVVATAVERLISNESESILMTEAQKLCKDLASRKKPPEKEEINKKVHALLPSFKDDEYEFLPLVLNKAELKDLRKKINLEMGRWKPIEYDRFSSLAYLVGRFAPNYASTCYVLDELRKHAPTFKPETYFDFGSGVGASLWAAHFHWSDSIKEYFCTDTSADMNDLCQNLITIENTDTRHINTVFFRQFLPASSKVKYDIVVSAFSLLELSDLVERLKVIDILWRKTKEYLVIIEYGTAAGFSCVLDARDYILKVENDPSPEFAAYNSGAHVISPCPHDMPCPKYLEKSSSSCGFTVPYHPQFPRNKPQVIVKDWISFVILKKGPRTDDCQTLPRIVKPVLKKGHHVICRCCCNDGMLKEIVLTKARHGRHLYRCARKSEQGDILPAIVKPINI